MAKSQLLARLHKSRERSVSVPADNGDADRIKFALRMPPFILHARLVEDVKAGRAGETELLARWIVGWDGMLERDIVPSGMDDPVDFELDVALEWILDRVEVTEKVRDELLRQVDEYLAKQKTVEGN